MECPFCGKPKVLTRAIRGAARHGGVECTCRYCNHEYVIVQADIDRELREREERHIRTPVPAAEAPAPETVEEIPPKLIKYRREYGLCVLCGEPAKNSRMYCEKRQKEGKGKQ